MVELCEDLENDQVRWIFGQEDEFLRRMTGLLGGRPLPEAPAALEPPGFA
jgi:hypothetical protein